MRDAGNYTTMLQQLLPYGEAWPRAPGAWLTKLLGGIADGMARIEARAWALLDEADPRTAYELLPDWERNLGLPDACSGLGDTIALRQLACWRKLANDAGQSRAFFISLAAQLGYTILIHEFDPAVDSYDGSLTALIAGGKYRFVWRVEVVTHVDYGVFRVGSSRVGDRLTTGGATDLECVFNAAKPSHTYVIFTYD